MTVEVVPEKTRFWFTVVGSLVGGVVALVLGDFYSQHIISGAGEALVIAGILALSVDSYLKAHLTKEVTEEVIRNVSPHLMGAELPKVLREEVHALCVTEVIRRDLQIDFIFAEVPGQPEFLVLTTNVQYEIENLSDSAKEVPLWVSVTKPYQPSASFIQIEYVGCSGVLDEQGNASRFEERATPSGDLGVDLAFESEDTARVRVWQKQVWVPPIASGIRTHVWSTTHQILPMEYQDAFISMHPTIGQTVRAVYPDGMAVYVQFGHRLFRQAHAVPTHRPTTWKLDRAFPGRAVTMVEWRKRPTPLPARTIEEIVVLPGNPDGSGGGGESAAGLGETG